VGAPDTCQAMRRVADEVVCAMMPDRFVAVGAWYEDFSETSDDEVRQLLERAGGSGRSGESGRELGRI
jgi:putative phosphoribosyl transferase